MNITIDGQDYSSALDAAHPLTIERKLNQPSVCRLWLTFPAKRPQLLARDQALRISGDDGTCYFTGYLAAAPMPEYCGEGVEGPRYRFGVQAISDEYLLDESNTAPFGQCAGLNAGPLLASLTAKTGSKALSTGSLSLDAPVANFTPAPGLGFSSAARCIADETRSAYRALDNVLTLAAMPTAVHNLDETDGTVSLENLLLTSEAKRAPANDITVCGEPEPTCYVTEYFAGDGVTTQFSLSDEVFAPSASRSSLVRELFNEGQIDLRHWSNSGSNGYLSLGGGGLVMSGGTGEDGDTQLTWIDPVEMGGTLLLEANGITLGNGSSGVIAGFFTGGQRQNSCTAGFVVTAQQGTGAVTVQPMVEGYAAGTAYQINSSNQYALRIRVHCPECQRGLATFRSCGDDGAIASGGQWIAAAAQLQFEIQEFVNGVAGMPITLYDGQIENLPGTCVVQAASSINLHGTMRSFNLTNLGSGWVMTKPATGSQATRRIGSSTQSAECHVESAGRLTFYPGFTPAVGEQIAVRYRARGRAVGRSVNTASQQALAKAGLPSVSSWIGTVINPAPRSSQDCRNAANALQQAASSSGALWAGSYKCTGTEVDGDVWPGDALHLYVPSAHLDAQVVVRAVTLTYHSSLPDLLNYAICFANDWADDLAIKTSKSVPDDAWLPAPIAPVFAPSLSNVTITEMNGAMVTVNTGASAPTGGGFEIRRCDNRFMPGADADLVMRSTQPTMTFQRVAASDRFYIRTYDGSNPPNYSEFSAALIFNLPLAV